MASSGPLADGHFLPRLVSVFFAIFHPTDGPKVLYQVPEGSITEEPDLDEENGAAEQPAENGAEPYSLDAETGDREPRTASTVPNAALREARSRTRKAARSASVLRELRAGEANRRDESPVRPWQRAAARSTSRNRATGGGSRSSSLASRKQEYRGLEVARPLFDFSALSDYLIPKAPLCGRLVTCTTRGFPPARAQDEGQHQGYKILGHPMVINSPKYARNMLVYNLCFVFEGHADVRAYEPIVRKCARSLRDLEIASSFLSNPEDLARVYGIIEQLFEDLNSYCESFVALPVLPHTRYGRGGQSGQWQPPQLSKTLERGPSNAGSTGSSAQHGPRRSRAGGSDAGAGAESMLLGPGDLASNLSSLIRGLSINTGYRAGHVPSSRASADDSHDAHYALDGFRSRSSSDAASGSGHGHAHGPFTSAALALTPVIENTQDTSAEGGGKDYFGEAISPLSGPGEHRRPDFHRMNTIMSEATIGRRESTASISSNDSAAHGDAAGGPHPGVLRRTHSGPPSSAGSGSRRSSTEALGKELLMSPTVDDSKPATRGRVSDPPDSRRSSAGQNAPMIGTRSTRSSVSATRAGVDDARKDKLALSIATLRQMADAANAGYSMTGDATVSVPLPAKREPPHGLGRTVRDGINVKLFPTYANPPRAQDWDVPVALLDLVSRIESDWDLTMTKIIPFIDGVKHVKRIAQLADADIDLTRQCLEHLLYYGCIIMIDVFQFSNMYSVRPVIARVASDEVLQRECAAYVTRPGYRLVDYPKLLQLFSTLRPGRTVNDWIEDQGVDELGIDPRRFVTFGVIKGFLRRVHRYPVLSAPPAKFLRAARRGSELSPSPRLGSVSRERMPTDEADLSVSEAPSRVRELSGRRTRDVSHQSEISSAADVHRDSVGGASGSGWSPTKRAASTLRPRVAHHHSHGHGHGRSSARPHNRSTTATVIDSATVALSALPRGESDDRIDEFLLGATPYPRSRQTSHQPGAGGAGGGGGGDTSSWARAGAQLRTKASSTSVGLSTGSGPGQSGVARGGAAAAASGYQSTFSRASDEAKYLNSQQQQASAQQQRSESDPAEPPADLEALLDGTHHDDELCVRYGVAWPALHGWLAQIGQRHQEALTFAATAAAASGGGGVRGGADSALGAREGSRERSGFGSARGQPWDDDTPLMSGFMRPGGGGGGSSFWRAGSRRDSRDAMSSGLAAPGANMMSGFSRFASLQTHQEVEGKERSASRDRTDLGAVKLLIK